MERLLINGGKVLSGSVKPEGAKNAVLPIMAAALMVDGEVILKNVPKLTDVAAMAELLRHLGVKVKREDDTMILNVAAAAYRGLPEELMKKMRASNLIWGPLLDRFSLCDLPMPGGCRIGSRPMDIHIKGMKRLGVEVEEHGGRILSRCPRCRGAEICLDFPSVGATENLVMAAVKAEGTTELQNVAREPEVADLCRFLNACGGNIWGIGTDRLIIQGVKKLHGTTYEILPDRIVGGTLLLAAMITGGTVTAEGLSPSLVDALLAKTEECGALVERRETGVTLHGPGAYRGADIKTLPYPGFPTDLQPQYMTVMALARGATLIRESIFENRFTQGPELRKMGADITAEGRCAVVRGVPALEGAAVDARDLRCGAALVLAGLAAEGQTEVSGVGYIERGYSDLAGVLSLLGADICLG